jgi:hypothetical protein
MIELVVQDDGRVIVAEVRNKTFGGAGDGGSFCKATLDKDGCVPRSCFHFPFYQPVGAFDPSLWFAGL